MMSIRKRKGNYEHRYFNVCLVLNEDTENQLWTNTPSGFNGNRDPFITWYKPTDNVSTVELVFRDTNNDSGCNSGHAQIADLKIFYHPQ